MKEKLLGRRIATSAALISVSAALSASEASSVQASQPRSPQTVEATDNYIHSAKRINRIHEALTKFAHIVVSQADHGGKWAPFDAYCMPKNINSIDGSGWVSQGFRPNNKDNCDLQHNPQYGGLNMEVDADVGITANGKYNPNDVTGAYTFKLGHCGVSFNYNGSVTGWDTIIGGPKVSAKNDTEIAEAAGDLKGAERIDNLGLACLKNAEATLY